MTHVGEVLDVFKSLRAISTGSRLHFPLTHAHYVAIYTDMEIAISTGSRLHFPHPHAHYVIMYTDTIDHC